MGKHYSLPFDGILIALGIAAYALATGYKIVLWYRYRGDDQRREDVSSSGQIYPRWFQRFALDEDSPAFQSRTKPVS
jgi:hypothetical protein